MILKVESFLFFFKKQAKKERKIKMYREAEMSNASVLEFATQCVSMGENLIFIKDALRRAFAEALGQNSELTLADSQGILADWHKFYQDVFNLEVDFSTIQISPHQQDFDRVLVIAQGLTLNQVYDACLNNFPSQKYGANLDQAVTKNDRNTAITYAIRIRDRVEADEELKNFSADDLAKQNIKGVTLLERLIYEFKYFKETGKHLDVVNITLCAGSRRSDGYVPRVDWDDGRLSVDWCHPDFSFAPLRSRAAV